MDEQRGSNPNQGETTDQKAAGPTPDLVRAVAEKVYSMLQRDLTVARERQRDLPQSLNFHKRGWP